jgi:hypothetical protein
MVAAPRRHLHFDVDHLFLVLLLVMMMVLMMMVMVLNMLLMMLMVNGESLFLWAAAVTGCNNC